VASLVFTLRPPAVSSSGGGGATISISAHAAERIRAVAIVSSGRLTAKDLALLRELSDGDPIDSDLRLVVAAIEGHGEVSVRII
jgi:hypothetical protein